MSKAKAQIAAPAMGGYGGYRAELMVKNGVISREPASDVDTAAAYSLKVPDPKRPIREAGLASPPGRHVPSILALAHRVDMVGPGKLTGAHILSIALHRQLDRWPEIPEALDEFRHPRRQAEHVLEH